MAFPMAHLICAYEWARQRAFLASCPEYYLGAISPDAIHMRAHSDRAMKCAVHLGIWQSDSPKSVLDYWEKRRAPFDIGYGIHILTDWAWVHYYRARFSRELVDENDRVRPEIYYPDCDRADYLIFLNDGRLSRTLPLLRAAVPCADHPYLSADEIARWRERCLNIYNQGLDISRPARVITQEVVENFLGEAAALVDALITPGTLDGA